MTRDEAIGTCYYCKGEVVHSKPHDYGAFTKRYNKHSQRYILSDFYHTDCYVEAMQKALGLGRTEPQYKQMNIFDFIVR